MSGLAGFDFERLNRRFLTDIFQQPVNTAADYGVNIQRSPAPTAWRCIGVYHLSPGENRGRHNVFVEVLDTNGLRTTTPVIKWSWWIDASTQTLKLDKPLDEPAADIPIEAKSTITLRVDGGGYPSDTVGNIHSRHADEGPEKWNSWGHHSFYVVFQLQSGNVVTPTPPGPTDPTQPPTLTVEQRLTAAEAEIKRLWAALRNGEGDGR